MEVQPDFRDLLELFNAHKVEYLIIGGYALAFQFAPRYTGDIDIFVGPDNGNAKRILAALNGFGFGALDLKTEDFNSQNKVVQLGVPPVRVDLLTSITGISWEKAFSGKIRGKYGGIPADYIGRDEFVLNKRSTGRKKDIVDIEALGEE